MIDGIELMEERVRNLEFRVRGERNGNCQLGEHSWS
jgi:hypothetical protein